LVAALVAATTALGCSDDNSGRKASTAPSSSSTSTTTIASQVADPFPGIWPFTTQAEADAYARGQDEVFNDPVRTAVEFTRSYGGMEKPVAGGGFRPRLSGAADTVGEVDIRPKPGSPLVTTVTLERTGEVWVVVAAKAEKIHLESPVPLDLVSSPVLVSGTSSSFEGNVVVQVKEDGMGPEQFLGQEPLTGGAGEDLEPFQGRVNFKTPTKPAGAVVALTDSAEDGSIQQLSAVRVRFERAAT
jgi:Immunoglobulin-like domain of bacterial spore germination